MSETQPGAKGPASVEYALVEWDPHDKGRRFIRWLAVALVVIVAIFLITLGVQAIARLKGGQGLDSGGIVEIGLVLVILIIGIVGVLGLGPGAMVCRWDPDGFSLRYRDGRLKSFRWNQIGFRCKVTEFAGEDSTEFSLSTLRPFLNPIPGELFQAIVSEAQRRGLRVKPKVSTSPRGSETEVQISAN